MVRNLSFVSRANGSSEMARNERRLWTKYISQGHFVYWPEFKEEIMSTLWPIDYEAIVEKYPLIDYEKE
jgi:hypothetical protein